MKKNKKGGLEISINAIVILILAITVLGIGLAFLRGMFNPPEEINESEEYETQEELKYCYFCYYPIYRITYVDKIWSENCYAMKQKELELYKLDYLEESFKYVDLSKREFDRFIEESASCSFCEEIRYEGNVYCLRDNSTCLIIEGKICDLIKLNED